MQASDPAAEGPRRIVVSPNRSLGPRGAVVFFLSVAAVVLTVAGTYTALGYWPILPFAGLELLVLAICLYIVQARGLYREVVTLDGDQLIIERGRKGPAEQVLFNRHWARIELASPAARNHPPVLRIREGERQCEIGHCLNESQRRSLHRRLQELMTDDPPDTGSAGTTA